MSGKAMNSQYIRSDKDIHYLVAIPTFGQGHLTLDLLGDLQAGVGTAELVGRETVVVDNAGSFDHEIESAMVYQPGSNLRWISTANWALREAQARGAEYCIVLNNDIRTSPDLCGRLIETMRSDARIAIAAPVYNDYWPHQRARVIPERADRYEGQMKVRDVPFCDGTAICMKVEAVSSVGFLDEATFNWHGYGADIDLGIRLGLAEWRSVVTENCYVSHLRRGTIGTLNDDVEKEILKEYQGGLERKWGSNWRQLAGTDSPLTDPYWDK